MASSSPPSFVIKPATSTTAKHQAWQAPSWRKNSDGLSSPPMTPSPSPPHSRHHEGTSWRRGSSGPPSPPCSQPSPSSSPKLASRVPWAAVGAWRSGGHQAPKRADVKVLVEWVAGRVVMLPRIPEDSVAYSQVKGEPWNHPQVITKTWKQDGVKFVKLRTCTSFHGEGIEAKKEHHRHYFVEADKSQLTCESDTFNKQTYVNCSPGAEFTIEFDHLTPWLGSANDAIQFSPAALVSFNKNEPFRRDSFF